MPFLHFRFLFLHFCPGSREATFTQNPWNLWVLNVVDQSVMVSPRDRNASPGRGPQECNGCTGWRHRSVGRTTRSGDGVSQRWLSPRGHIHVLDRNRDLFLLPRPPWGRQGLAALREPIGEANLGSFTRGPLLNPVLQRSGVVKHSSGSQSPRFPSIRKTTKTTSL